MSGKREQAELMRTLSLRGANLLNRELLAAAAAPVGGGAA